MTELRWFKFVTTLVVEFKKIESDDETKYSTFYSNSKAEAVVNESNIDDIFQSIYTTIMSNIQKSLEKGWEWIIDWMMGHNSNISKCNTLGGTSYIKLLQELDHLN